MTDRKLQKLLSNEVGVRLFGGFGGGQPVGTVEWIIEPHLRW